MGEMSIKVLHLNDHYQPAGGAETILLHMLDALEEQGVVNVVVHQHPAPAKENRRRLYHVPDLGESRSRHSSTVANALRKILQEERPDLVHIHDIGNPDVSVIGRLHAPTVQSVYNHSFYCPGGAKYLALIRRICQRPFGKACLASAFLTHCNSIRPRVLLSSYYRSHRMLKDNSGLAFLTLSKYQADRLVQSGCPADAVKVLPPFPDLPSLRPLRVSKRILFAGRIVKQKD